MHKPPHRIIPDSNVNTARRRFNLSALGIGAAIAANPAFASTWQATRPVSSVVPYSPGGGADILARFIASKVGSALGRPMVVENKAGVNGIIGANYVYTSKGDGATLLLGAADNISIAPHIYKSAVKFDQNAFKPVAAVARMVFVLCSRAANKPTTYKEAIADLRSRECSYGHWGPGSLPQVGMEMLKAEEKIPSLLAVPYGGAGPIYTALLAGEIDYAFLPIPMIQGARSALKLYASGASERHPAIAEVPTFQEMGIPIDTVTWFGYLAPPDTPSEIVEAQGAIISRIVHQDDVRAQILELGYAPMGMDPKAFAAFVPEENKRWGAFVQRHGIVAE